MPILQHYYTSFVDPETSRGGFRTKAASPGLSAETTSALLKLLAYRVPPSLDARDIASHPIALRYCQLNDGRAALLCSRSCGADEGGRAGNFFAHSLVVDQDDFANTAPIAYFGHALWQRADPSPRSELPVLTRLDDAGPALGIESVWSFLADERRRGWFRLLLSAAIDAGERSRPIVILDRADNVARWVAAVTYALPPRFRPGLTFSTYHHDPYASPCIITGTTSDAMFRFSPAEYQQYFVLNTESGLVSEQEPTRFAEYVCERYRPDRYDELTPFFEFAARRSGGQVGLGRGLDTLTALYLLLTREEQQAFDAADRETSRAGLDGFGSAPTLTDDDVSDLMLLTGALRAALAGAADPALLADFRRAALLSRDADSLFSIYLRDDLDLATGPAGAGPLGDPLVAVLDEVYGRQAVDDALNDPSYLGDVAARASSPEALTAIWRVVGSRLRLDQTGNPLLARTMEVLTAFAARGDEPPDGMRLVAALALAAAGRERLALAAAVASQATPTVALVWLYYAMARPWPLQRRAALRAIVEPTFPKVLSYEFEQDLGAATPETALALLDAWLTHPVDEPRWQQWAVTRTVHYVWEALEPSSRPAKARFILTEPRYRDRIEPAWTDELVRTAFSDLRIHRPSPDDMPLLERYAEHPALDNEARDTIGVCMALARGRFEPDLMQRLNERLATLDAERYRAEAAQALATVIGPNGDLDAYASLVRGAYVPHHQVVFWEVHGELLIQALSGARGERITDKLPFRVGRGGDSSTAVAAKTHWLVDLLDFWFARGFAHLGDLRYPVQQFFLTLPGVLGELQQTPEWDDMARGMGTLAGHLEWYPSVQAALDASRSGGSKWFRR